MVKFSVRNKLAPSMKNAKKYSYAYAKSYVFVDSNKLLMSKK